MHPAKRNTNDEKTSKNLKKEQKFDRKVLFYSKVKDHVRSLHAKKDIKKKKQRSRRSKLKAYDLSVLSEFLPDFESSRPAPEVGLTFRSKTKQKLVEKESIHLKAVLSHPAFQADPLSTIHQHILNTQPQPESVDKRKPKEDGARRKSRRKGGKPVPSDVQSMDTI